MASSIEAGKNYLIVSGGYALKNNGGSVASVSVNPVDGVISLASKDEGLVWTAAAVTETTLLENGNFTFSNKGYRFSSKHGSNPSLQIVNTDTDLDKYAVWSLMTFEDNNYLYHVSGNYNYYAYYNSGWKMTYVGGSSSTSNKNPTSKESPTQLYVEQ